MTGDWKLVAKGFTMIELAITVTVLAFAIVSVLSINKVASPWLTLSSETQRVGEVVRSVERYAASNCRLPCPADGLLNNTASSYGLEDCAATSLLSSGNVLMGVIPFKTLGIDENLIKGETSRFSYAIDRRMADATSSYISGGIANGAASLVSDSGTTQSYGLVIFHRFYGHGSWPSNGGSRISKCASTPSSYVYENSEGTDLSGGGPAACNSAFNTKFVNKTVNLPSDNLFDYVKRVRRVSCPGFTGE